MATRVVHALPLERVEADPVLVFVPVNGELAALRLFPLKKVIRANANFVGVAIGFIVLYTLGNIFEVFCDPTNPARCTEPFLLAKYNFANR